MILLMHPLTDPNVWLVTDRVDDKCCMCVLCHAEQQATSTVVLCGVYMLMKEHTS